MSLQQIPTINACLNSLSFLCLVLGYGAIRKGHKDLHKKLMVSALFFSSLFLSFYLYYHYHFPTKKFPDLGFVKTIYLTILLTHTVLAVVMLPLIFITFRNAFKGNFVLHRKWARRAFPIWTYVSATGVLIYFMLYHWFVVGVSH